MLRKFENSVKKFLTNFFKDKNGNIVVWQKPNIPILVWVVAKAVNWIINTGQFKPGLHMIGQAALVTWAYLELRYGDSNFRRLLGFAVLVFIIYGLFF